jgi:hypothetical protein
MFVELLIIVGLVLVFCILMAIFRPHKKKSRDIDESSSSTSDHDYYRWHNPF